FLKAAILQVGKGQDAAADGVAHPRIHVDGPPTFHDCVPCLAGRLDANRVGAAPPCLKYECSVHSPLDGVPFAIAQARKGGARPRLCGAHRAAQHRQDGLLPRGTVAGQLKLTQDEVEPEALGERANLEALTILASAMIKPLHLVPEWTEAEVRNLG